MTCELASENGSRASLTCRVVGILCEIDDAIEARLAIGVELELGSAFGAAKERCAPDPLELPAMLELTLRAGRVPLRFIAALRCAERETRVPIAL